MGSGGCRVATPLDVFVEPERRGRRLRARSRSSSATTGRGRRATRRGWRSWSKTGAPRGSGASCEQRVGRPLPPAGPRRARIATAPIISASSKQKQPGLNYVGLVVPVGRITADQLFERRAARGRRTATATSALTTAPERHRSERSRRAACRRSSRSRCSRELPHDPPPALPRAGRCTGIDYCHFALIETKDLALAHGAASRRQAAGPTGRSRTHWSGCPAGCGNHAARRRRAARQEHPRRRRAGRRGRRLRRRAHRVRIAKAGTKVLEDVPCDELPDVLERLVPYVSKKRPGAAAKAAASDGASAAPAAAAQGLALNAIS